MRADSDAGRARRPERGRRAGTDATGTRAGTEVQVATRRGRGPDEADRGAFRQTSTIIAAYFSRKALMRSA